MLPYLLILLLPSLFALLNTRRLSLTLWYTTFVIFVIFVGLRYEVGPDWAQYRIIHRAVGYEDFWSILGQVEPLSHLLFWISETTGYDVYLSNTIAAIITMTGVFAFARRTPNPWLAVVAATPYFILIMGMSGVRQIMAAAIVLFLFSRWERYTFLVRAAYILIAAMFHTSALVNNIFLIIKMNIRLRYKIVIGAVILAVTMYLSFGVSVYSDNMVRYQQRYLEGSFISKSVGSFYHIAMIAIPAMIGVRLKHRILHHIYNPSLLHFGLYAAIATFAMSFFSSTLASRLTIYLYFVPMLVYPALVASYGPRSRLAITFLVILYHLAFTIGWFGLGNVAFAYIPYKNVLFDATD